jgi:pilus assembly protein CpaC
MFANMARRAVFCLATFSAVTAQAQSDRVERTPTLSAPAVRTQEMTLLLGEQKVLSSQNVKSYSEGVKGIIDVRLTQDMSEFVVVALQPGTTTLLFLMLDGTERHYAVTVVDPTAKKRAEAEPGVQARENIRLDFYFVQLNKNYGHQVGIGFPGQVAPRFQAVYDVKAGMLDSATAVVTDQALPRLDMAQTSGWAKIMRQAAVVTANGEKASFAGGQEVNILIQNALATGVQKIQAGSLIEVEPIYDSRSGRIELRLHADISELENDRGTGVPGRTTSALDTVVNLELGQSIVLAGLSARSERKARTGLPGLSQIPLLGLLFGSHAHAEDETENVVLIVPSVVDAVSMQDRERITQSLKKYKDFSGNLEEVSFVPEPKLPARKGRP